MTTRVFGFLLPGGNEIAVEDSDEEEEEEEEDELLDMRDITGVADGAEIVEGAHTRTTSSRFPIIAQCIFTFGLHYRFDLRRFT